MVWNKEATLSNIHATICHITEIYFIKVSVVKFESSLPFGIVKNNRIKTEINAQEVHIYHSLNKCYREQQ